MSLRLVPALIAILLPLRDLLLCFDYLAKRTRIEGVEERWFLLEIDMEVVLQMLFNWPPGAYIRVDCR